MRITPKIIKPFEDSYFHQLQQHTDHVRKVFDWPGLEPHDAQAPEEARFNRWFWHNLPMLVKVHHDPVFLKTVSDIVGTPVKPSYAFLSMYAANGICPPHVDRPQCQFTVDLCLNQDAPWPIYVDENPYYLEVGQALVYSGTHQPHYRKRMSEDSKASFINLAFFHFVPTYWMGPLS